MQANYYLPEGGGGSRKKKFPKQKPSEQKSAQNSITKGGYFDLELAPESYDSIPFGEGHLTVWKHAKVDRFFVRPLAYVYQDSAKCSFNVLTGRDQMTFDVLMISQEAKLAVADYMRRNGRFFIAIY